MKQFMSVMNSVPKDPSPPAKPSIKIVDGVPWLTFSYTTRSASSTSYTVRADIDQVSMDDIPAEFQQLNCLYPSANGAEEDYKGSRRDYEQECNEQGWKLTHLNPMILSERKGVLQRAVISLRNASSEQKSRRVKQQEKKTQSKAVEKDVRGPVLSIPRGAASRVTRALVPVPLTWQPAVVSSLQEGAQRPVPSDLTPQQHSQPQVQAAPQPTQRLPSLGSFETSTSDLSLLEFDGYIQGQFKRLRLQISIGSINLDDLPHDFKKNNCVYPRSFLTHDDQSEHWNTFGIRQAEESFLNEIGWKLCSINTGLLNGKRLLLQQALDAYRRRFLPSTGQPRARVGPSLLTRRSSSSNPVYSLFNGSDPSRTRHRKQLARVRFDIRDSISGKGNVEDTSELYSGDDEGNDKYSSRHGSTERESGEEEDDEVDDEYGSARNRDADDDGEGEDFVEDDEDDEEASEGDSFEDESGDGSSSEEVSHSQMSLLSFTGSIRTYSLGTGSGSARSRPRIRPTTAAAGTTSSNASPLSRSETLPTRKRSWTEFTPQTHLINSRVRFDKRIRQDETGEDGDAMRFEQDVHEGGRESDGEKWEDGEGAGEVVEDVGRKENESEQEGNNEDEDEGESGGGDDDEDEVDWWKSRLNNSEYAEDHHLVSMTTEELIGALTNCYNSDAEEYYDDDD
ncbi:hypothetical protein BGZ96_012336 [Linnemannia gamsii]|uniref:DUF8032 domain-containing protein n=1 Tax=Linnemannia gamsii TaxID=64522 RepID=A0ABQ7JQL5_9FUNG|nr:hypothetical protein BGZ96_012336 [Linnemannia gamsii]